MPLLLLFFSLRVDLPSSHRPIRLYSNQTRDDLRLVVLAALDQAQKSISLHTYALTDPSIIQMLQKKALQGICVKTYFDPSTTKNLPAEIEAIPVKTKGLMHEKRLIVDEKLVILGSANMTTNSLQMHDNLLLGLYDKKVDIFHLPQKRALERLIEELEKAKESIDVAMFTFTHPLLAKTLIRAHNRGVRVRVAIDGSSSRGASKKVYTLLKEAGVHVKRSTGIPLLHHKLAFIDNKNVVIGSANWTKAAFTKNRDYFLILSNIPDKEKNLLLRLFKNVSN